MPQPHFTVVPAVYVVLRRDAKVLLLERANTGAYDGVYALPAGHIEGGESAVRAAVREVQEEVGVKIAERALRLAHVTHRVDDSGDYERVDFFFEAEEWEGEPYNAEPEKCSNIAWFAVNALPDNIAPLVRRVLKEIAAGIVYSHHNFKD